MNEPIWGATSSIVAPSCFLDELWLERQSLQVGCAIVFSGWALALQSGRFNSAADGFVKPVARASRQEGLSLCAIRGNN